MKKVIITIIATFMLLGLCSCNSGEREIIDTTITEERILMCNSKRDELEKTYEKLYGKDATVTIFIDVMDYSSGKIRIAVITDIRDEYQILNGIGSYRVEVETYDIDTGEYTMEYQKRKEGGWDLVSIYKNL